MAPRNRRGSMVRNTRTRGFQFLQARATRRKNASRPTIPGKKATVSSLSHVGPVFTVVSVSPLLQNLSRRRFNENLRTFNWI